MFARDLESKNYDLPQFALHGYNCLSQGKTCSNKGGLIIYVDNNYRSEVKMNLNMYAVHTLGRFNNSNK